MEVSDNQRPLWGSPCTQDYRIVGSIFGSSIQYSHQYRVRLYPPFGLVLHKKNRISFGSTTSNFSHGGMVKLMAPSWIPETSGGGHTMIAAQKRYCTLTACQFLPSSPYSSPLLGVIPLYNPYNIPIYTYTLIYNIVVVSSFFLFTPIYSDYITPNVFNNLPHGFMSNLLCFGASPQMPLVA